MLETDRFRVIVYNNIESIIWEEIAFLKSSLNNKYSCLIVSDSLIYMSNIIQDSCDIIPSNNLVFSRALGNVENIKTKSRISLIPQDHNRVRGLDMDTVILYNEKSDVDEIVILRCIARLSRQIGRSKYKPTIYVSNLHLNRHSEIFQRVLNLQRSN